MSQAFEKSIWYLRAEQAGTAPSQGSAVGVRLRRKGHAGPFQTYLLTCAHVIRRPSGTKGQFGPAFPLIRAWRHGDGYNPAGGLVVIPVADVVPLSTDDPEAFYRQAVAEVPNADWCLLGFDDLNVANSHEDRCVRSWLDRRLEPGERCDVYGFPGGEKGFEQPSNLVRALLPFGNATVRLTDDGLVVFNGVESRRGMSGGGVFLSATGEFVGLHRQRDDSPMQLATVSARQVRSILEKGYEIDTLNGGESARPASRRVDPDDLSREELQALVSILLETSSTECRAGSRIEMGGRNAGPLTLILSPFAADAMHRLALRNDMELLQTQSSGLQYLQDLLSTGAGGAMNVPLLSHRAEIERDKTMKSIRDRVRLMLAS